MSIMEGLFKRQSERRPETRVLNRYLYRVIEFWARNNIVTRTQRETATLEVCVFEWLSGPLSYFKTKNAVYAYIHYDTQVLWIWYNGRIAKCTTVDEFEACVNSMIAFYTSNRDTDND